MNTFLALIIQICISISIFSQTPTWTNPQHRKLKYSDAEYLKGYAEYKNQQKELVEDFLEKLKGYAQTELIQSVQTTIESASVLSSKEDNLGFSELFKMSSVSTSAMSISGLQFETYYDIKTKTGYAFAYAKRSNVKNYYLNIIKESKNKINERLEQAKLLQNEKTKQLNLINSCYTEFRKVEEAQSILYAIQLDILAQELQMNDFKTAKLEVELLKSGIEKSVASDIQEAASLLAYSLKDQLPSELKSMRLQNLSYQDTKMGSSFSRRFSKSLEQMLNTQANINVVSNVANQDQGAINQLLTGTYWQEGNYLRIIIVVKDIALNKTLASAEVKLSLAWLSQNNINYKAENFQQAYASMKTFKTDEVSGGGLIAEVWTNKGDENLIYTEGEKLKLFVRINRECFIRFIYHLADGSRVLFVDNYYIGSDKVNTVYELPFEFECAEPFGVETLQLNAQTKAFDALNTKAEYGYDFIIDGLNEVLISTRGFKKVTSDVLKAEKRVVITTMKE
ncbi:MAG: hypothetical protein JEZ09_08570 [Salinivirgaceae bacterium]|nr:hypothetical protein [Salinivirgaceae bacterium]